MSDLAFFIGVVWVIALLSGIAFCSLNVKLPKSQSDSFVKAEAFRSVERRMTRLENSFKSTSAPSPLSSVGVQIPSSATSKLMRPLVGIGAMAEHRNPKFLAKSFEDTLEIQNMFEDTSVIPFREERKDH